MQGYSDYSCPWKALEQGSYPNLGAWQLFDAMCKLIQMLQKEKNRASAEMGKGGKS